MTGKRSHERHSCEGIADLTSEMNGRIWGRMSDISLSGFYVSAFGTWPVETEVRFKLEVEGQAICGTGAVATNHPGVGMAVEFREMLPQYEQFLMWVIRELAENKQAPAAMGLRI